MDPITALLIASFAVSTVSVGIGFVQQKKAAEVQANQIRSQTAAQEKELKRQVAFEQQQLEDTRRVQRLNADMAEAKRQRNLRSVLATQRALASGRFDVSTSRSFMTLTEETIKTAELDIQAIRLGADISEHRSFLEQEEIQAGAEAGILSLQAGAAANISNLNAAVRSTAISGIISTVGAGLNVATAFQGLPKAPSRTPSPTITPKLRN